MKLTFTPPEFELKNIPKADGHFVLFGQPDKSRPGHVGTGILEKIRRRKLAPTQRALDLMAIGLSAMAADMSVLRKSSPDGWTRQIELTIAVNDPAFWGTQAKVLERLLRFLTTDIWTVRFIEGGVQYASPKKVIVPNEDCVVLLSGGLDSLVGAIDLVTRDGKRPFAVSQIAHGDGAKQVEFAKAIGSGLTHIQFNHNASYPGVSERSLRARSIVFLVYGALIATTLKHYQDGDDIPLYVCENGFISANPPLTGARLGSLSTRTTNPVVIALFQELLNAAEIRVKIKNPYQFKTKGEMLIDCADQKLLQKLAHKSTSCGRFARHGHKHCGRCVPCMIRRAAFIKWHRKDKTEYVYNDLSPNDAEHARFDDVRAAGIALAQVKIEGLASWLGGALNSALIGDVKPYEAVITRGLQELAQFFKKFKVK